MHTKLFLALVCMSTAIELNAQESIGRDPELEYSESSCRADDLVISRVEYHERLQGFWLGQCIANWTGLRTEGARRKAPFYTDEDWGTNNGRNNGKIELTDGIRILNYWVGRNQRIGGSARVNGRWRHYGGAKYWSVLRSSRSRSKLPKIQSLVRNSGLCN